MKHFNFFYLCVFAALTLTFIACDDDEDGDDDITNLNIVETAQATDDLSILVDAVSRAGLVATLESDGPFTVFAPTNDAFQALFDGNGAWNSIEDIDEATLQSVLLFHVLGAEVRAADLADSYVTTASTGPNDEQLSLQVDVTDGVIFNGAALPITTDVDATNGVVHIIDEVMLPPNVVNFALNNPVFSSLVAALTRSDLNTNFVEILTGDGPFTVFAPTNDAFSTLINTNNDWDSLSDIPVDVLEAVLTYHVVSEANVQADQLADGMSVTSLGGTFNIDLDNGAAIETTSGQSVNIVLTDVQGTNGVVHVIDSVLLP